MNSEQNVVCDAEKRAVSPLNSLQELLLFVPTENQAEIKTFYEGRIEELKKLNLQYAINSVYNDFKNYCNLRENIEEWRIAKIFTTKITYDEACEIFEAKYGKDSNVYNER